jgi:hypothetical protein
MTKGKAPNPNVIVELYIRFQYLIGLNDQNHMIMESIQKGKLLEGVQKGRV